MNHSLNNSIARLARFVYYHLPPDIRKNIARQTVPLSAVHDYWKEPEASNQPEGYIDGGERSEFLISIIDRYANVDAKILEVGCNVGRNLDYLHRAGFTKLSGIEINQQAIELFRLTFPRTIRDTSIYNLPVEKAIKDLKDEQFDIVFTMAVLQHIHPSSEWVFKEIARITKSYLLTIEDEQATTWLCFPRNYKDVFEKAGMKQVEEVPCQVVGLGLHYKARIFTKETNSERNETL